MAKKTKDAASSATKGANAPVDPAKTKDLLRLLNILALLLAIAAFLLQLFAVLSHHWKWQSTDLRQLISPTYHYAGPNVYDDSRLDQNYGLYSREVKVYGNHEEQVDLWASTRFPRIDDGEGNYHQCLSQTSTLRGALLTCSDRVISSEQCHCRRYQYWNFVIALEIIALILLGIVVVLTALLTTQYRDMLKPAAAGLALLAFILLLIGLILIFAHLKRETRSLADAYPHVQQRLADKLGVVHDQYHTQQRQRTVLRRAVYRRAVRRQTPDHYRAYTLLPGQHAYNDTHYQEFSDQVNAWVYRPYASIVAPAAYASVPQQREGSHVPHSQRSQGSPVLNTRRNTTVAPAYNEYGPVLGYDNVFDHTRAGIGWSTVLSILATILSLLLPLILIYSWLTGKKDTKKEYVSVPQHDVVVRPVPTGYSPDRPVGEAVVTTHHVTAQPAATPKPIPTTYSSDRSVGEAVVTTHHPRQGGYDSPSVRSEPGSIVRDVVIPGESPRTQTTQQQPPYPINVDTTHHT